MPERYRRRRLPALFLGLLVLAAVPVSAIEVQRIDRLFAGRPATIVVFGELDSFEVTGFEDLQVVPGSGSGIQQDFVLDVNGRTWSGSSQIGHQIELPPLVSGLSRLLVRQHNIENGEVNEVFELTLSVEPSLVIDPSRRVMTEDEQLEVRARFTARAGFFVGTASLEGNKIRLPLVIFPDSPFLSKENFDLESESIGPFPPGEYELEIWDIPIDHEVVYHREKIVVTPRQALLQQGRFLVEILLDAPHEGKAKLATTPGEDSALFYFFSETNWESMVKVLDACELNGNFWVFSASSTDVGYVLEVTDTESGQIRSYSHPAGSPAPAINDTAAFSCAPTAGESR